MKPTYLTFLAALALAFTSCKKETHAPYSPTGTADLKVKVGLVNGHSHVDMDHTFTDGAGNTIKFTELKFFVGHMHLEGHHGDEIAAFHNYHLFDGSAHHNHFHLGQIPAGHIHYLKFKIGLDEHACMHDPANAPHPMNTPGMHCHDVGYRFLSITGRVDVDGDGNFDGPADLPFMLHCGAPDMLRSGQLNVHGDVAAGSTHTIQLEVNVAELVNGLDLRNNNMHMGGGEYGAQLMDNLKNAIGVHHH
jgi:hypothetical protein